MAPHRLVSITVSPWKTKKWAALFEHRITQKHKTVHFGAAGMGDYTLHRDPARLARYLVRHKTNEDWHNYLTPGALSRWILWNKPSMSASIADYRRRFGL